METVEHPSEAPAIKALGHLVFNGKSRVLKMFLKNVSQFGRQDGLLHQVECHDVGINDQYVHTDEDEYGHKCKCPPGTNYIVGRPMPCATRLSNGEVHQNNSDDPAYGCWFIPLGDSDQHSFEHHYREGIGVHGGGSDLSNPFAWKQGWEWTYGCLRLQNIDLERTVIPFVNWVLDHGGEVHLDVVWDG